MVESNYPLVTENLNAVLTAMTAQAAKYPDRPLNVRFTRQPAVFQETIHDKYLDDQAYGMILNDIYLGSIQDKMDLSKIPTSIEPGAMAIESAAKFALELPKYNTSISPDGLSYCENFFFQAYGRQSPIITQNIYHPESIVMRILNNTALVNIMDRDRGDMLSKSFNNYPIIAGFDVDKFITYMAKYSSTDDSNIIYIDDARWTVAYNNNKVSFEEGGIWDRNARTFGTWSSFPHPGDWFYGINLAGYINGILDRKLMGTDRTRFVQQQWEKRINYLCLSASLSNFQYSYIFDYILK